jgi:hypothetical protein
MDTTWHTTAPLLSRTYRPNLPRYVLQCGDLLGGVGKHETGLTRCEPCLSGVEVVLVLFDLDGNGRDVVVKLMVARDLSSQAPVIHVSHSLL